jgi:hypothetical protein
VKAATQSTVDTTATQTTAQSMVNTAATPQNAAACQAATQGEGRPFAE